MIKEYIENINKHYNKTLNEFGMNIKGLGWRNNGLNRRYKIITNNYNFVNKTVLDFGCGLASFFLYLKKNKIKIKNYTGVEINPKIRNFLLKKFKNNISIQKKIPKKKFDIIVSNGVHNYKVTNIENIFYNDIDKLFKITKKILILSFINDNVDYKEKYLSYKKILKTIKYLQRKNYKYILNQTLNKYETFLFILK